jgi:hypothetical protein
MFYACNEFHNFCCQEDILPNDLPMYELHETCPDDAERPPEPPLIMQPSLVSGLWNPN